MKKLWQKKTTSMNPIVEAFETKGDIVYDQKLIPFDIQGSVAHVKMLLHIGLLTEEEFGLANKGLNEILTLYNQNKFQIDFGDEDMHTKIENYLTDTYGDVGKKIHTARSRNDQVLTALRLYSKRSIQATITEIQKLKNSFQKFTEKYKSIPMPGYTHMQKAMPSSIGLWSGSFIDAFTDDIDILQSVYNQIDQSPLGSAAGYGLPITIDRTYTAKELGFSKVQKNAIYCQNSRGKFDANILSSLISVQMDINKFASDMLLFTTQEYNFFSISESLCSGSSIMPQKKNIDIAELLRSKVHVILGNYTQIVSSSSNLISGYNRDMQDNKKPLIDSFDITLESIKVANILITNTKPNHTVLKIAMTDDLYATEKALQLVLQGKSFRDAYKEIAKSIKGYQYPEKCSCKMLSSETPISPTNCTVASTIDGEPTI